MEGRAVWFNVASNIFFLLQTLLVSGFAHFGFVYLWKKYCGNLHHSVGSLLIVSALVETHGYIQKRLCLPPFVTQ